MPARGASPTGIRCRLALAADYLGLPTDRAAAAEANRERTQRLKYKLNAWRAARPLFPEKFITAKDEAKRRRTAPSRLAVAWDDSIGVSGTQRVLDEVQGRDPRTERLLAEIDRRRIFDEVLIATHVRPPDQPAAAEFLRGSRFRTIPKILVADAYVRYAVHEPEFARAGDLVLFSVDGRLHRPIVARRAVVIGGFETMCLSNTLESLIESAIGAGLPNITLHVPTRYTYSDASILSLEQIRTQKVGAIQRREYFKDVLTSWRLARRRPGSENRPFEFRFRRLGNPGFRVILILE